MSLCTPEFICRIVGHSHIVTHSDYWYCGRCHEKVADDLDVHEYPHLKNGVVMWHNCQTCVDNYKKMKWWHKIYVSYPFRQLDKINF